MIKRIMSLGLSLCAAATVFPLPADQGARLDTHQIILRLKDDGVRRIQAVRHNEVVPDISLPDGRPLIFVRPFDGNGVVVRLPEAVSLQEAQAIAAQLVADSSVVSAQADKRMYPALVPNDPRYPNQWNLFEDAGGIRMQGAWDRETGSAAGVIAQLDTGIIPHVDLDAGRVLPGYDFFSGGLSNLNTELDNDPVLGDPVGRDNNPTDPGDATVDNECEPGSSGVNSSWHGLSVAGVMVAKSDNTIDIAGIDFAARLLPVRVLGKCGGSVSDVADAIRWAAGLSVAGVPANPTPARVINMSLSGAGSCTQVEQDAINAAVDAGAVVVVSAGNEDVDVATQSPANCQKVVTVGAMLRDGSRAPYSNSGEAVDLSAPGGLMLNNPNDGILVLSNNGTTSAGQLDITGRISGSSFSTAQASAVASLMLAVNSSLSSSQVRDILILTTRAFPDAGCNTGCGSGILDADAALAGAADPASVLPVKANTGGGGGGCTVAAARISVFDPLLLLLVVSTARRSWRKRKHLSPPVR
ncbi:MAG: S8 family peptidase [Gammaproteobacteria bacterium]|nr:MAG: S8 family peptidase [Gammaproteobacteria bacterium]